MATVVQSIPEAIELEEMLLHPMGVVSNEGVFKAMTKAAAMMEMPSKTRMF